MILSNTAGVMLTACKDLEDFRGTSEAELKAWLIQITSNVIADIGRHYSRKRRDLAREQPLAIQLQQSSALRHRSLVGKEATPSEGLIIQEDSNLLIEALLILLEDERTAVVLKHLHSWPISDIALHLNRSDTAVAGLLRRGLSKLRSQLRNED